MVTLPIETLAKFRSGVITKKAKGPLGVEFELRFKLSRDLMHKIFEQTRQPNSPDMYAWLIKKVDDFHAYALPGHAQRQANYLSRKPRGADLKPRARMAKPNLT